MTELPNVYANAKKWQEKARELFASSDEIAFVCPACNHRQTVAELRAADVPEGAWGFSCIGRWTNGRDWIGYGEERNSPGPCNYAGGGLFRLNPVQIMDHGAMMFQFSPAEEDNDATQDTR